MTRKVTRMSEATTPDVRNRAIGGDDDSNRVRDLLIETHAINPPGLNWEVRRWDGWRFYNPSPEWDPSWEALVRLWETRDGRLVGVVNPEGRGYAFLQVHPDYRHLIEDEMLAWAERHLSRPVADGGRQLLVSAFEYDHVRERLLERRGYEKLEAGNRFYLLRFAGLPPMPEVSLPDGYRLRTTRPDSVEDAQLLADLLNAAFRRDFHNADEYLVFTRHAPSFRRDLDLVAEPPDGTLASYVGMPYDEQNRHAIFEPVCTHPDHVRKGLAQTLMREALRRAQASGAVTACTETGRDAPANRLYESIGFTETYVDRYWRWSG